MTFPEYRIEYIQYMQSCFFKEGQKTIMLKSQTYMWNKVQKKNQKMFT